MKKILLFIFVLLLTVPVWGIIAELDSETWPNLDISSIQTILTDTPDGSNPMLCQAYIVLGSAGEPLEGSGGAFEFTMTIGGQTVQPSPQIAIFGTDGRASIWTSQFLVPAGEAVVITVESPNADTADVTAYLYDVFPVITASGLVSAQLADGVTHGGADALLVLKNLTIDTDSDPSLNAVDIISGEKNGINIESEDVGIKITGGSVGIQATGVDVAGMLIQSGAVALILTGITGDISAAEIDDILDDTNELQTDWTDGGRLDLLVDDIIDKVSAMMSKAYTLLTAVGAYDPATDSLEAQQENPQAPPIID